MTGAALSVTAVAERPKHPGRYEIMALHAPAPREEGPGRQANVLTNSQIDWIGQQVVDETRWGDQSYWLGAWELGASLSCPRRRTQ
jgi:hypothetical protein